MKKILLIIVAVLVAGGLVGFMVYKQQSGYTKVMTAKLERHALSTIVSGTGQIKPRTYVNLGATAMGRVTHFYVKEGDRVYKGEVVATIENIQQEANVAGQQAAIAAARTDIASYVAAIKTAQANVAHAKADLDQKKLDWQRAQALYKEGITSAQDYDASKAAYDLDVASVAQAVAQVNQANANAASARGHLRTQESQLTVNKDLLQRTVAIAPFNGIVTNEPIRQGETVVEGIQNAEGSTLMTLADMSVITAEVKVDETDIINLALGQPAEVTVDAIPGKVFKGKVTLVGDQALLRSTGVATSQSTTGTEEAKDFKVVVTLTDPSGELKPGLSCTAKVTTAYKNNVLALPIQALTLYTPPPADGKGKVEAATTDSGNAPPPRQGVFIVETDKHGRKRARFVPVKTGITGATDIEVLSGLKAGDQIVIGPYKTLRVLKDGALLKEEKTSASNSAALGT
ncbi:MAG TPA: efflux RND transporter periplasmic adaptor subunit [Terracidiphilus sp.]|nr:efflux RND transporter periplasmic adaptor subunit [Terracidiphilus sp.]